MTRVLLVIDENLFSYLRDECKFDIIKTYNNYAIAEDEYLSALIVLKELCESELDLGANLVNKK